MSRHKFRVTTLAAGVVALSGLLATGGSAAAQQRLPAELFFSTGAGIHFASRDGELHDMANTQGLRGIAWSPDGTRLLALRGLSIVVVGRDGRRPATVSESTGLRPVWSPDGRRIAFQRGGGIYISARTGRQPRRVANAPSLSNVSQVSWSPDGTRLVYAGGAGSSVGLYIVNANGGSPKLLRMRLAVSGRPSNPAWSPRVPDSRIAFELRGGARGGGVYIVRADGTGVKRVGAGSLPVWSPDGARLAFAGSLRQKANYVVRADGTQLRRVGGCTCETRGPGFSQILSWSPDGSQIAYVGGDGQSVWTVRHDGKNPRLLAAQVSKQRGSPIWPFWRPSRP